MKTRSSSDKPAPQDSFAEFAEAYRESATEYLAAALELAKSFPYVSFLNEQRHRELSSAWKNDPTVAFETTTGLLVRKACLHVTAALRANEASNMHSLAAQMCPALECAGQVVTTMKNLIDGSSKGRSAVLRRAKADYYKTITRLTQGQINPRDLLPNIAKVQLANDEIDPAKARFQLNDTVKDLEFGGEWYSHLSEYFFHSDLSALKGRSYCGGVRSADAADDQVAFGFLLDYLTDQVLIMIRYGAMFAPETKVKKQRYMQAVALAKEKRKGLTSYRGTLELMLRQENAAGTDR